MAISIYTNPESQICPGENLSISVSGMESLAGNFIIIYVDGVSVERIDKDYATDIYKLFTETDKATNTIEILAQDGAGNKAYRELSVVTASVGSPTIGSFTLTPVDSDGKKQSSAVQGITKIKAEVSGCKAGSGDLEGYRFTGQGQTKNSYTSYSGTYVTFSEPTKTGYVEYTVEVFNTNGYSTSRTESIYVDAYNAPFFSKFKAYRSDENGSANINGEYITCEYKISYSSVNGNNKISADIYIDGECLVEDISDLSCTYTTTKTYSVDLQHNVYVMVSDNYGSNTKSKVEKIYPSGKILNIAADGQSIGIGALAPKEVGTLKCDWNMLLSKLNGRPIPEIEFGKVAITGGKENNVSINYSKPFSDTPAILFFPCDVNGSVALTGSLIISGKSSWSGGLTPSWSSGTCDVYWMAVYVP